MLISLEKETNEFKLTTTGGAEMNFAINSFKNMLEKLCEDVSNQFNILNNTLQLVGRIYINKVNFKLVSPYNKLLFEREQKKVVAYDIKNLEFLNHLMNYINNYTNLERAFERVKFTVSSPRLLVDTINPGPFYQYKKVGDNEYRRKIYTFGVDDVIHYSTAHNYLINGHAIDNYTFEIAKVNVKDDSSSLYALFRSTYAFMTTTYDKFALKVLTVPKVPPPGVSPKQEEDEEQELGVDDEPSLFDQIGGTNLNRNPQTNLRSNLQSFTNASLRSNLNRTLNLNTD